ncbi:MAG: helix-turn-helix domain-containing protein [Candidatus Omnitrophica bacterium]|nr:helix-turn-helix domain-containing protein [Candidatus Omnitrophota bacterium]
MKPKGKEFIDDKTAEKITCLIDTALGQDLTKRLGRDFSKDMIRFHPVAQKCKQIRQEKGLTIKQVATSIKVPQYRLRAIEDSSLRYILFDVLKRYVDFLGLTDWFILWKDKNKDVYRRLKEKPYK